MGKMLRPREKIFVHAFLASSNGTQACIEAGYPKKSAASMAYKLLHDKMYVHVQDSIKYLSNKKAKQHDITIDYVLGNLKKINEKCMNENPILDKNGNEVGKEPFKENGAIAANKLMGQYLRMWTDDEAKDTSVSVTVMPKIMIDGKEFKPKLGK